MRKLIGVLFVAALAACGGTEQGGQPVDEGGGPILPSAYSSSYTTMYVRGTNNSWGTTAMSLVANNTWQAASVTFGSTTSESFKFDVAGNWTTNWGDNNNDGYADSGGANIVVSGGAGSYTITFNDSTKAYTVVKAGDATAPTVSLTAPAAGATLTGVVTLSATASDNVGVAKVDFLAGTTVIGTDTTSPYSVSWDSTSLANGSYAITAKAYDAAGNVATSSAVTATVSNSSYASFYPSMYLRGTCNSWGATDMVKVATYTWQADVTFSGAADDRFKFDVYANWATNFGDNGKDGVAGAGEGDIAVTGGAGTYRVTFNDSTKAYTVVKTGGDTTVPTVALSAPAAGATLTGAVAVTATASDNVGVTKVEFYAGAALLGTATASPWTITWTTTGDANGTYSLTAKAYDAAGNSAVSAARSVTVSNTTPDTTNPTVALSAPAAGAILTGAVTVSATASDNKGVTKVEFYAGTTLIGTATASPYSLSWNTAGIANGTYALTAKAYDAAANNATSAARSVTVSNTTDTGLTVHFKRPSTWGTTLRIHYWNVVPTSITATTWPGNTMTSEGSDWYKYTIPGATSASIVFNDGAGHQTGDLSRTGEGWYFTDNKWYDQNPEAPKVPVIDADLAPGLYVAAQNVRLTSSNTDDVIYYTLDGTTPTTASTRYTAPIDVGASMTIKAFGVNRNAVAGSVYGFAYTIDPNADVVKPSIVASRAEGYVGTSGTVSFTVTDNKTATTRAYYTTDGSTPTTSSTLYVSGNASAGLTGGSFTITSTVNFKFLVVDGAGNQATASFNFYAGTAPVRTDFRAETIYFVITSRFYDGDASNNVHCWDDATAKNPDTDPCYRGDFEGLIQKLDYIKALGFSAVWITPVVKNSSGYDYHGYHAINHKEVDPRYATKSRGETAEASYKRLIDEAHARGMKIIQDIVVNHTGNFGEENLFPMFKRNAPTGLNEAISAALTKLSNPWLPANYDTLTPAAQYSARINAMKEDANDTNFIYHHEKSLSWESYTVQTGQIAGDCVDLNTENPTVQQYLVDAYNKYIDMGVDGFRVDTVKHVSRLDFNKVFIPAWKARGGDNFFVFGEVATRYRNVWNSGIPAISTPFFTWKETVSYPWGNRQTNEASVLANWNDNTNVGTQPTSNNHLLSGNTYHAPDWSRRSGLDVIDFPMHWSFTYARDAFSMALGGDQYYSDPTWNVTYVDSHDYAPDGAPENQRYAQPQDSWAEDLSLIFTFRGVPTIFYGSEIEFQKGMPIDVGPNAPLSTTGRAYFGDKITGSLTVTGFGQYSGASGNVATTLSHPLAQHIRRLNLIRRAVPALQMGQYSTEGVSSGGMAFKRRYTSGSVDSFALVTVSGDATFTGIPNGTYVDAITGASATVTGGSLTITCSGKGNARVYVLSQSGNPAPGKIGVDGTYLK
ncbi:MAG: Ig-like domain-containing protein [Anaeromyxobacter sp.]